MERKESREKKERRSDAYKIKLKRLEEKKMVQLEIQIEKTYESE